MPYYWTVKYTINKPNEMLSSCTTLQWRAGLAVLLHRRGGPATPDAEARHGG